MTQIRQTPCKLVARRLMLRGYVQGIGMRPAIVRLANELELTGWVCNSERGVEVWVEGDEGAVERFCSKCQGELPSRVSPLVLSEEVIARRSGIDFQVLPSEPAIRLSIPVPRDVVTCEACLEEVWSNAQRRTRYWLTTCCECGPRYTVIREMPFERDRTAMSSFPLCDACEAEWHQVRDRRFHAQTMACPTCGPEYRWFKCDEADDVRVAGELAEQVVQWLKRGHIIAFLGIGGYQLLVDALNETAIANLRARKERKAKPLPILVADLDMADRYGILSQAERKTLTSRAGPIVVVPQRPGCLPHHVAPGFNTVGIMLPTTPFHAFLANSLGPVIATSGNREGIPLAFRLPEHEPELRQITDRIVFHNREIIRPIDDSVVHCIDNLPRTIRLARGLAPHSMPSALGVFASQSPSLMKEQLPSILAVGGHQKVAIAIWNGEQAVLGPHLGDMDTLEARQRFVEHVHDWERLYHFEPEYIVSDMHPDYFTTQWARDFAQERKIPTLQVQHHHAHIVAGMIESNWLDREVLGVAWDGTGWGMDGSVWGGEFLCCSVEACHRIASLHPFVLPAGEQAIRQPKRIAEWLINFAGGHTSKPRWTDVVTTSAGRLFDAVAAMLLPDAIVIEGPSYEGHFAALLESLADSEESGSYSLPLVPSNKLAYEWTACTANRNLALPPLLLDWSVLLRELNDDLLLGMETAKVAMRFHRALANGILEVCERFASLPVVLSGGVFQNRLLSEMVIEGLKLRDRQFAYPITVPVNDGGLAAGQLYVASRWILRSQGKRA